MSQDIWITNETPPRVLFVKGRSGVDPDCLVAYAEGGTKPLWIVDDGGTKHDAHVCGLDGDVRAATRRVASPPHPAHYPTHWKVTGDNMIWRILIVVGILGWYVGVRYLVLTFAGKVFGEDREDLFARVWSWFIAIPLTVLSIMLPGALVAFILYGP